MNDVLFVQIQLMSQLSYFLYGVLMKNHSGVTVLMVADVTKYAWGSDVLIDQNVTSSHVP